jgi:hypothetical protein
MLREAQHHDLTKVRHTQSNTTEGYVHTYKGSDKKHVQEYPDLMHRQFYR